MSTASGWGKVADLAAATAKANDVAVVGGGWGRVAATGSVGNPGAAFGWRRALERAQQNDDDGSGALVEAEVDQASDDSLDDDEGVDGMSLVDGGGGVVVVAADQDAVHSVELATLTQVAALPIVSPKLLSDVLIGKLRPTDVAEPLQEVVREALGFVIAGGGSSDDVIAVIASEYIKKIPMMSGNISAVADALKVDRRSLANALRFVASTLFNVDRAIRAKIEASITQCTACRPLLYVDFAAFDETPMVMVTPSSLNLCERRRLALTSDFGVGEKARHPILPSVVNSVVEKTKATTKLLQSEQRFAMLFEVKGPAGDNGGPTATKYAVIVGDSLCGLQQLQSTKGQTVFAALAQCDALSPSAQEFDMGWRFAVTDGAGSNDIAGEMVLVRRRGGGWERTRWLCELHRSATAHVETFSLVDSAVSGMIRLALSLSLGSASVVFRATLKDTIAARISIRSGTLSSEAQEYKTHVMRLFLSCGRKRNFRAVSLSYLPNGDWRNTKEVEYYPQPGEDLASVLEKLADGITMALYGKSIHLWRRDRWTGSEVATSDIGLLEGCHGLLSAAYHEFCKRMNSKKDWGSSSSRVDPRTRPAEQRRERRGCRSGRAACGPACYDRRRRSRARWRGARPHGK